MYDFISLNVKCPNCGASLMDPEHPVDNKPGIRLLLEMDGIEGEIVLSSIYGSYNFESNMTIASGHIAHFSCPHCKHEMSSEDECLSCGSHMVPFYLDMGGKVSICSRNGCKNHFVEFEDLSVALQRLYQEYGYEEYAFTREHKPAATPEPAEAKENIESGTFLYTYCPHCYKSLLENDQLKLKVTKGDTGYLMLSPYLNVFTNKSTIYLPENQLIEDIMCWHCGKSLILTEKKCGNCASPVARIAISTRTRFTDFYICTKKGCRWHGLKDEDMNEIRLDESLEW